MTDKALSWSERALAACLEYVLRSPVIDGQPASVDEYWVDGPDAFCVVYRPAFDPTRRIGLRRARLDSAAAGASRESMTLVHDVGDVQDPDPTQFGRNVADFDIGAPHREMLDLLEADEHGLVWWGTPRENSPHRARP
jgi:hypothetical protein